jgi:hypothetical protein
MSEDIPKGSTSPQPEEPWQERPEGPKPDLKPPYPKTIVAAAILLLVSGGLWAAAVLLRVSGGLWVVGFLGAFTPMLVFILCSLVIFIIWPAFRFVRATSTAKDTGGIGRRLVVGVPVLSLFIAYLEYLRQTYVGAPVPVPFPANLFLPCYILTGAAMLSAGILFLVGRAPYRAWRNAEDARKKNGSPKEGDA